MDSKRLARKSLQNAWATRPGGHFGWSRPPSAAEDSGGGDFQQRDIRLAGFEEPSLCQSFLEWHPSFLIPLHASTGTPHAALDMNMNSPYKFSPQANSPKKCQIGNGCISAPTPLETICCCWILLLDDPHHWKIL